MEYASLNSPAGSWQRAQTVSGGLLNWALDEIEPVLRSRHSAASSSATSSDGRHSDEPGRSNGGISDSGSSSGSSAGYCTQKASGSTGKRPAAAIASATTYDRQVHSKRAQPMSGGLLNWALGEIEPVLRSKHSAASSIATTSDGRHSDESGRSNGGSSDSGSSSGSSAGLCTQKESSSTGKRPTAAIASATTYGGQVHSNENAADGFKPSASARKRRVTLTKVDIIGLFNLPQPVAASRLGVSLSALKNACRKVNIARWPYQRCHYGPHDRSRRDSSRPGEQ